MTGSAMTADDVFERHGIAPFVDALVHHGAMTPAEADAMRAAGGDPARAREFARALLDRVGDGGEGWFKYEISEIGYNVDVTSYGYGDATLAKQWEVLNEQDNTFVYVTRLSTMEALACGLLAADGPGARFCDLIARLQGHRLRDAALKAHMRAAWAARNPMKK